MKNILLVSPQRWGVMHVSKHHYAIGLARTGNRVYFLNPPLLEPGPPVAITPHDSIANLYLVDYRLSFPYNLRFHLRWLYDWLMARQVRRVLKEIGLSFDIVWCFETNLFSDLRVFGARRAIYHLADQIMSRAGVKTASTADLVVAVDRALLSKLEAVEVPKQVVGHGLAPPFARLAEKRAAEGCISATAHGPVRAGYVGNLLISSLDRTTLASMVDAHPQVVFHFWGSYGKTDNNVGGGDCPEAMAFVQYLQAKSNTVLHGAVDPERLAEEMQAMDAFVLCYDIGKDINGGCNSHKILEYLSTGKVIISSQLTAYENYGNLLRTAGQRDNSELCRIFSEVIEQLPSYNDPSLQKARVQMALDSRYSTHIERICQLVSGLGGNGPT